MIHGVCTHRPQFLEIYGSGPFFNYRLPTLPKSKKPGASLAFLRRPTDRVTTEWSTMSEAADSTMHRHTSQGRKCRDSDLGSPRPSFLSPLNMWLRLDCRQYSHTVVTYLLRSSPGILAGSRGASGGGIKNTVFCLILPHVENFFPFVHILHYTAHSGGFVALVM